MNNFWQRAITGTLFVVVLVGAIMLGGWYAQILFGIIVVFGLNEFYNLFDKNESKPQKVLGIILGGIIYVAFIFKSNLPKYEELFDKITFGAILLSIIVLAINELFRNQKKPFENISITYIGIIYIVVPFLMLCSLYVKPHITEYLHGTAFDHYWFWPVLSIFILVWCNDTFAYLTGRLFGKHKLFERISPKKTWEGFIGGIIFAVIAGIILAYFLHWSYAKMITYGLVVGIIGTAGDLVESMLKRSVNVKDSGNILPGHGGILDRFDAVLFVVPVIFFLERSLFN